MSVLLLMNAHGFEAARPSGVTQRIAKRAASSGLDKRGLLAGNVWPTRARLFAMVRADIEWAEKMQTPKAVREKREFLVDPFRKVRLGHAEFELDRRRVKRVPCEPPDDGVPNQYTGISPERVAWDSLRQARLAWLWEKSGQLTRLGRPFELRRHPWDCAHAQLLAEAAVGAKDFRRLAQYRRACRAAFWPCDEDDLYPAWLKPQRRAKVSHVSRLKKDRTLEAYDPIHPIGNRHELRQVFEATTRRDEQTMMTEIVAAVYGKPPTWMKPRAADKPGRKTKAGGSAGKKTR